MADPADVVARLRAGVTEFVWALRRIGPVTAERLTCADIIEEQHNTNIALRAELARAQAVIRVAQSIPRTGIVSWRHFDEALELFDAARGAEKT